MIGFPRVLLRADEPAFTVARRIAETLGWRLSRQVNRSILLTGPAGATDEERLVVGVDRHWAVEQAPELFRGYDIDLAVVPASRQEHARDSATIRFFEELCRALGYPGLLVGNDVDVVAGWTPMLGTRWFPSGTFAGSTGRAQWLDYAQPSVVARDWLAADDVLGQLSAHILADPDADQPRLAYADAVAGEHPDYAELIRAQVAYRIARRAGVDWSYDQLAWVHGLERALRDAVVPDRVRHLLGEHWLVRRGFVESAALDAAAFLRSAGRIAAQVPLRMVYLTGGAPPLLDELAASPELGRLVGLSFWGNPIGDAGLTRFLRSPYLHRLRYLSVQNTGVTRAGIEALAASDALPELRYVRADPELRLNPVSGYDYDGTQVTVEPGRLGSELSQRFDRAWPRWQETEPGRSGGVPEYDEV